MWQHGGKKYVKKSQGQRKGRVVAMTGLPALEPKVAELSKEHGALVELRAYDSGAVGAFFANGKFRFVKGVKKGTRKGMSPNRRGALSKRGAARAFNKYYREKRYKGDRSRKAAITRDMCHRAKNVISDRRYRSRTGPKRYDFTGVDDGSRCKGEVKASKPRTAKQLAVLGRGKTVTGKRGFQKQRGGYEEPTEEFMMGGYYYSSDDEMQDGGADGCSWSGKACSKKGTSNPEWCQMGKKGRCVKSAAGKRSAPKRTMTPAQVEGLKKGQAKLRAKRAGIKAAGVARAKASPKVNHLKTCKGIPESICKKTGNDCTWMSTKKMKSGKMRRAHCKQNHNPRRKKSQQGGYYW
jgi:hypothetical protein